MKRNIKNTKFNIFIILFVLLTFISLAVPTLSRYKSKFSYTNSVWDGTIASSYHSGSGTEEDPYVITNGNELAFFKEQLKETDYENTFFVLKKDIFLNDKEFSYQENNILYNENILNPYEEEYDGINLFEPMNTFKGKFDGNYYAIYGLFITKEEGNVALFKNLEGTIENLYLENTMIYGGEATASICSNALNSNIKNILIDGYVIGNDNQQNVTAGVCSNANNTNFIGVINKAYVYGEEYSAGIVGLLNGNSSIIDSYNTKKGYGLHYAGLISKIENNPNTITLRNVYNDTENSIAFISTIDNSNIVIENSFNTSLGYLFGSINNSNITLTNVVNTNSNITMEGTIGETITVINTNSIKEYAKTELEFNEYIDNENVETNKWIYESNDLPTLYYDDSNNISASIIMTDNSWNDYSYEVDTHKFSSSISFIIQSTDLVRPINEIYYYISNSKNPLTYIEVENIDEWVEYNSLVNISGEGFYIIYAKLVDNNGNISYINSDLLVIDETGSTINISLSEKEWNSIKESPKTYFIDSKEKVIVSAQDSLSGVKSIEYYISQNTLTELELNNIEDWNLYTEPLTLDTEKKIIYVRVIDNVDYITYASTDYLKVDGYNVIMHAGYNLEYDSQLLITSHSKVSLKYTFECDENYETGYIHTLNSNINIPMNTTLYLTNNINKKTYKYVLTEDSNIINLTSFKEVGTTSNILLSEEEFTGQIEEDFTLVVDFNNSNIIEDLNDLTITLTLKKDDKDILKTIESNAKKFSVISGNNNATLSLTTNFNDNITLNTNMTYNINLNSSINNKQFENKEIIDTTYESKYIGYVIKITDSEDKIVKSDLVKNIEYKVNGKKYYMNNSGLVYIDPLNNDIEHNLQLTIYKDNSKLENGEYKLNIGVYSDYDGVYPNINNYQLKINANMEGSLNIDNYSFDVRINNEERIINKTNELKTLTFEILKRGTHTNKTIRMSFYEKTNLTAYNQEYTLLDLSEYSTNSLTEVTDRVYLVEEENNEFKLNIDTSKLNNTGYMILFELYEDDKKIEEIEKKFIVK